MAVKIINEEYLPKYLYVFPSEEMRKRVKIASTKSGMSMKDFITEALQEKIERGEVCGN